VFLAQLVLALTPLLEGREGPDARAHVEEAGIRVHHVHDEAYCSACTVRHLLASSEVLPVPAISASSPAGIVAVARVDSFLAAAAATTRSRAPPVEL
jgi:hypothetical protein